MKRQHCHVNLINLQVSAHQICLRKIMMLALIPVFKTSQTATTQRQDLEEPMDVDTLLGNTATTGA